MIQKRVTRALLASVAAVITALAAAGVSVAAQANTAGRPDLTEQWQLNRVLSDDAAEKLAEGSGPASSLGVAGVLPRPVTGGHDRNRAENSRMRQYVRDVAGPGPLVGTFLVAGVEQLGDVPKAWDQDLGGYGRRLASIWGRFTIQTTVTHALAAVLDRPAHYRPCECAGRWQRVHHALLGTIRNQRRRVDERSLIPTSRACTRARSHNVPGSPGMPMPATH